jgi:hypothetical protein
LVRHLALESWFGIIDNLTASFLIKTEIYTRQEAKRWPGAVYQKNTAAEKQPGPYLGPERGARFHSSAAQVRL